MHFHNQEGDQGVLAPNEGSNLTLEVAKMDFTRVKNKKFGWLYSSLQEAESFLPTKQKNSSNIPSISDP